MLNQIQSTVTLNTSLSQVNNYLDKVESNALLKQLNLQKSPQDVLKENSWYFEASGATLLTSVAFAVFAAIQIKQECSSDRVVTCVNRSNISGVNSRNTTWTAIRGYKYCDKQYHLDSLAKTNIWYNRMWSSIKKSFYHHLRAIALATGQKDFISFVEGKNAMMYNSEDDFIRMLIEWVSTIKENVNALDLTRYEDLGWMAVFPTIGVLFRMIADNYGEHVSTVALGCLSIKALDTLGPRVYMFGTISTLIISAIKNSMTLDSTDVNYSANLVAGMVAIPAAFYTIKKTIMLNQIQSTVTLNTSLSQVNNYLDKVESNALLKQLNLQKSPQDVLKENSWYFEASGATLLTSVAFAVFAAIQIKQECSSDRVVTCVNRSNISGVNSRNTTWTAIRGYKYCDKQYHLDSLAKTNIWYNRMWSSIEKSVYIYIYIYI
ncbi:unnamed protein product [Bemisia tabaci]|uniref:Uncharacterized protein n=1 Tax=Bemisia tabaci TaxID=7038 RepID=A0A9P0ANJ5_BEMTA|nr:unnamed protein product [Bemisia tabaci]